MLKFILKIYLSYYLGILEFIALSRNFNTKLSSKMDRIQKRLDEL